MNVLNVQNICIAANGNTQAVGNSSYVRIQLEMYAKSGPQILRVSFEVYSTSK